MEVLKPMRVDFRPEKANWRFRKVNLRLESADFRLEGGTGLNEEIALCGIIGHPPLRGRYPKKKMIIFMIFAALYYLTRVKVYFKLLLCDAPKLNVRSAWKCFI